MILSIGCHGGHCTPTAARLMFQSSDFRTVLRGADSRASWSDIVSIRDLTGAGERHLWKTASAPREVWLVVSKFNIDINHFFVFLPHVLGLWIYNLRLEYVFYSTGSTANQRCRKGLLNWTQAHATMNHFQDTKKLLGRSCARNVDTGGYEVNHIIPRWPFDIVGRVVEVESSKHRLGIFGTCLESRWF